MGQLKAVVIHSNCLRCIIGVKLTNRHNLKTIHKLAALQPGSAMRKDPVVATLSGTSSSWLAALNRSLAPWPEIRAASAKRAVDRQV
eukprot:366525-Chlamydomonas_euryale.AAC.9